MILYFDARILESARQIHPWPGKDIQRQEDPATNQGWAVQDCLTNNDTRQDEE
jgi:hypothetical protein